MSKNNSIKKKTLKDISPIHSKLSKEKSIKYSSNSHNENKNVNNQSGIIEVYEDNFIEEIKNISSLLDDYNYIGMDTEFPGTVFYLDNATEDFYYKGLKKNVDNLKLIQLGITLTNEKGEFPKNYPYHTWQFNLKFDINKDTYSPNSINLLKDCGIDFEKLKTRGIKHNVFAQYFMISNLVLNPDVNWISFHGSYDFAYLLKLLINMELPEKEEEFMDLLDTYFINYYDIKVLTKDNDNFQRGLNKLADQLEVNRVGQIHQAGSDSGVTIDVFFKLKKSGLVSNTKLNEIKNILYGIGKGQDNDETYTYTQMGGMNYQNNNLMYINVPINTNYLNMNYYNYSLMLNNQNNSLSLHKNNGTPMQTLI